MATPIATPAPAPSVNLSTGAISGITMPQILQNLANFKPITSTPAATVSSSAASVASTPSAPVSAPTVGSTPSVAPSLPVNAPAPVTTDVVGTNAPVNPTVPTAPQFDANGNPITPALDQTAALGQLSNANAVLGTKPAVTAQLQSDNQLAQKQQDATDTYNAYQTAQLASQQRIAAIYNQPGIGRPQADEQAAEASRIDNANLANLAVIAQTAAGNLSTAQSIISSKLSAQFDPIQSEITNLQNYITANNANLSDSDKAVLNANLTVQTNTASELLTAKENAYSTAIQYGNTDPAIMSAIDNATTLGGVYSALSGVTNPTGTSATSSAAASTVNGYDMSTYGYTPAQIASTNATSTAIGGVSTPDAANAIIQQLAPKSPVTGAMVIAASAASGVDPNTLLSVMQQESNIGTQGAAVTNNNPGNVKYTGQAGATKGTAATDGGNFAKFKTVQDGINAMATSIAAKKVDPSTLTNSPTTSTQTSSTNGYTPTQFSTLKASAPLPVQGYLNYVNSGGNAYIDGSNLPAADSVMAASFAKAHNIPIINSATDVADIKATDTVLQQIDKIQNLFTAIAPTSVTGALGQQYSNSINSMLQNSAGQKIAAYNAIASPTALGALASQTGSARVSSVTSAISAAELPAIGKRGFLMTNLGAYNGDTLATGLSKINALKGQLNTILTSINPNLSGSAPTDTSSIPGASGSSQSMVINGTPYTVGQTYTNSTGQKATLQADGTWLPAQ